MVPYELMSLQNVVFEESMSIPGMKLKQFLMVHDHYICLFNWYPLTDM